MQTTDFKKESLYREAMRLLKRAQHLLDEAFIAHSKEAEQKKAA